jgi:NitT/TauT family transport system permease protein
MKKLLDLLFPLLLAAIVLAAWEGVVDARHIPPYILPAPSAIWTALIANWPTLAASMLTTITVTLEGFAGAFLAAILLAILFCWRSCSARAASPSGRSIPMP